MNVLRKRPQLISRTPVNTLPSISTTNGNQTESSCHELKGEPKETAFSQDRAPARPHPQDGATSVTCVLGTHVSAPNARRVFGEASYANGSCRPHPRETPFCPSCGGIPGAPRCSRLQSSPFLLEMTTRWGAPSGQLPVPDATADPHGSSTSRGTCEGTPNPGQPRGRTCRVRSDTRRGGDSPWVRCGKGRSPRQPRTRPAPAEQRRGEGRAATGNFLRRPLPPPGRPRPSCPCGRRHPACQSPPAHSLGGSPPRNRVARSPLINRVCCQRVPSRPGGTPATPQAQGP